MAESDQVTFHYVQESTRGTTPTNPAWKALRINNPRITLEPRHIESNELRSDRQVPDYKLVAIDVNGEVETEVSYGNADDWLEAAMCGTWSVNAKASPTAVTTTQFTLAAGGTVFKKGMLVRGVGFGQSANNALFKLAADGTGTAVTVTGAVAEPSPPAGAYIKAVGFQCASGDAATNQAAKTLTISSSSGVFTGLVSDGEWVKIGGKDGGAFAFATAGCNGWARVAKGGVSATTLTFDIVPAGWATDAGSTKTIRLTIGDVLDHGTTRRPFSCQRRANDLSPVVYETSVGQEAASWRWELRPQDIARGFLGLMGDTGELADTQIAGSTDTEAPSNDVMGTGTDIGMMLLDGADVINDAAFWQTLTIGIDNRPRQRTGLGKFGYNGRGFGRIRVGGQGNIYFADKTLANKVLNNTDVGLAWAIADAATHTYLVDTPALKLAGSMEVGGVDTDIMLPVRVMARRHPTLGYTIRVQRFDEQV